MDTDIVRAVEILKNGGIGVLPTDTLYGIVGQALDKDAVERIQVIKKRSDGKPFIILISSLDDLKKLGIDIDDITRDFLLSVWPGPVSVVLPCNNENVNYLHQGMDLAIRWPKDDVLEKVIKETGPLVAPSANPEGLKPAATPEEAKEYFGDSVDFCVNGGTLDGEPSTLVSIVSGEIKILRQGKAVINI